MRIYSFSFPPSSLPPSKLFFLLDLFFTCQRWWHLHFVAYSPVDWFWKLKTSKCQIHLYYEKNVKKNAPPPSVTLIPSLILHCKQRQWPLRTWGSRRGWEGEGGGNYLLFYTQQLWWSGEGVQWFHRQTFTEFHSFGNYFPPAFWPQPGAFPGVSGAGEHPPQLTLLLPHPQCAFWAETSKFSTLQECVKIPCLLVFPLLFSSLLWVYIDLKTPFLAF